MSSSPPTAGDTFRFGWSRLSLLELDGGLRIAELDFARWPGEVWVPSVDVTLEVLSAQIALLHRVGQKGQDVSLDDMVVAAPGALDSHDVYLLRSETTVARDSGWVLARVDDPDGLTREADLEAVAIGALVSKRRALLQALTLPAGFIATFSGSRLTQVVDEAGRTFL